MRPPYIPPRLLLKQRLNVKSNALSLQKEIPCLVVPSHLEQVKKCVLAAACRRLRWWPFRG